MEEVHCLGSGLFLFKKIHSIIYFIIFKNMKKENILIALLFVAINCNSMVTDTTYIICNDSSMIKKNVVLVEKNKGLKARNVASSIFAGIGFVTAITLTGIILRP